MGSLLSILPVVVRRIAANARLLLAVVVGAVLASALMSTTSIYTDAIRDLGLSFAIRQAGVDETNILVRGSSQPSEASTYRKDRDLLEDTIAQSLGPLVRGQTSAGRSATFFLTAPGGAVTADEGRPRSHLQFFSGLERQIQVVEGRFPAAVRGVEGQPPAIEVALGGETARRSGLKVGDRFDLHPFWAPNLPPVRATLVGLIEPVDAHAPYWLGFDDAFSFLTQRWETYPFFVPEETYFGAVAAYLPTMTSDFWQLVYLNTGRIDSRNAERVHQSLLGFDRAVVANLLRTTTQTKLPDVLATYDEKLFFTRAPLLVLVLQIAGIVLYYLFMVSTMLIERQQGEIALLKSRGATTLQVMQIYIVEGLAIAAVGLALGPPLAAGAISLLGQTPPFADLSGGENLSVRLTGSAYLWALSGAILAYATLLWPAYQATKRTVVQQRVASSRPPREAAFTRYYLDMVLVGVGVLLFYQLDRRGALTSETLFGEQTVDPLRLLTPAFFILTVGIVFLRLFPVALRLLAWVIARAQGTAVLIGMWQLVRNPVHYARLVLLLMLATAVGMFAASFGATLERSYADRAAYQAGAPLRLAGIRKLDAAGPNGVPQALAEQFGASASSSVTRMSGSVGPLVTRQSFEVLGIDPNSFAAVAFFRDDFADRSLAGLLDILREDEPREKSIALPPEARWLGVWLNPTDLNGRTGLEAKVSDATGRFFFVSLGPEGGVEMQPGWVFLAGELTRPRQGQVNVQFFQAPPQPPLRLHALAISFFSRVSLPSGSILVDDLQAGAAEPPGLGATRLIADFNSAEAWEPLQGLLPDSLDDQVRSVPAPGGNALELLWRPVRGQPITHGLRPKSERRPLAVIASGGFLEKTRLKVGETDSAFIGGSFVEVEVVARFDLFPTLKDPRSEPAVLANGSRLATLLNAGPRPNLTYPDEAWLAAGPDGTARARQALQSGGLQATVVSFEEIRTAQEKDPLIAAGWEGILFISFAAILLLSSIGFLIYSYLTAQKRTLEFAVLRTMGFSRRQIATVVGFEQAFVIGLGMVAGTLMGLRLGSLMIRYMGVTETGDDVLPPMLLHVSWFTVGSAWLILGFAFLVTIGIVVLLYSRLALHRVLRIGES